MFKKHKYKFLAVLILFIVIGGGTAYYFKKKTADKKAENVTEKEGAQEQPKEPLVATEPVEKPVKKQEQVATKQILVKEAARPQQLKAHS